MVEYEKLNGDDDSEESKWKRLQNRARKRLERIWGDSPDIPNREDDE